MRIALIMLSLLASTASGQAQISDDRFRDMVATVRHYAGDMTQAIPCMTLDSYVTGPNDNQVEDYWGRPEVSKLLANDFKNEGGSKEQLDQLLNVYDSNYKPSWSAADIREFARRCGPVRLNAALFTGLTLPLAARAPFVSH